MNKTANIQASFSLPDVLVEDKIERMGNNQMKITIPKTRSMAKDSAPIVYAVQVLYMKRSLPIGGYDFIYIVSISFLLFNFK